MHHSVRGLAILALFAALPSTPGPLLAQPAPSASSGSLRATFFGTSTLSITDGGSTIMIDGFLSRPPLWKVLLIRLSPDRDRIAAALQRGRVGTLCGVFVAHSHYDHALDATTVASRDPATLLFGGASTARIARAEGFDPARIRIIPHEGGTYRCGGFEVTAIPSPHSPGGRFPGEVAASFKVPANVSEYRVGDSYAFVVRHGAHVSIVHPSANFRPGMYRDLAADVVFLGVGSLGKQPAAFIDGYWTEAVGKRRPKLVVPIHWDDFTRSLAEPLRPMPRLVDNVPAALSAIRARAGTAVEVRIPGAFQTIDLNPPASMARRSHDELAGPRLILSRYPDARGKFTKCPAAAPAASPAPTGPCRDKTTKKFAKCLAPNTEPVAKSK